MRKVAWEYFNRFKGIIDKYMEPSGEGATMASQTVTAVNKLVFKWYNDGDVFDNTGKLSGWLNDLSDYANWLYNNVPETQSILLKVSECDSGDYEHLLKELSNLCLTERFLIKYEEKPKQGSVYNAEGPFVFIEETDDDDEESWEDAWESDEEEWEDY